MSKNIKQEILICLIIFLSAISIRLPFYKTVFWRTPDAVEYISVGRNLYEGLGLTRNLKNQFLDNKPVVSSALSGRPILMPILISLVYKINNNFYAPQVSIILVGSVNAILIYLLARLFLSLRYSSLAAFLVAFNPNLLITNRLVVSEFVFTFFCLVSFYVYYKVKDRRKYLFLGLFSGLAFLTRFEGIWLLVAFGLTAVRDRSALTALIIGFFITTNQYFIANYQINGSPFYTYNTFHYRVFEMQETARGGFGRVYPSVSEFILHNWQWIVFKVSEITTGHIVSLLGLGFFGPLSLLFIMKLKKLDKRFWPIFFFCLFQFLTYASLWSGIFERERHFIPIYHLMLIPIISLLPKFRKIIVVSVLIFVFISYWALDIHRLAWARDVDPKLDNWTPLQKPNLFKWLKENTNTRDIIVSPDPSLVNLFTARSTILIPEALFAGNNYSLFTSEYAVTYYLVDDPSLYSSFDQKGQLIQTSDKIRIYCANKCSE